jgi:3-phosphoglycerate kinase
MTTFRTLDDGDFGGKRVLVRVDFNVPLENGEVADDTRIRAALPTIERLRKAGARVILMSHLGRPKGGPDPRLSLRPVAVRLEEHLGTKVGFAEDCVGQDVQAQVEAMKDSDVMVLENLRFHPEEKANDEDFAARLAALGERYVNDAFGTAHRAHASTVGVPAHLPGYAGLLLARELKVLGGILKDPERPFVAVLGGSKVSGKVDVIQNLMTRVDTILVGGAMAFTFSRAQGGRTGQSLVEGDRVEMARTILAAAKERGVDLRLPTDVVATRQLKGDGEDRVFSLGELDDGWKGVDIGPKTVNAFAEAIGKARTVLLNGPMGVFEVAPYHKGTCAVLEAMASNDEATTVLGGGDSAAAAAACRLADHMTHVSTGGGASLELLEGKTLPAVAALNRTATARAR